jgi:hypothetical protein
VKRRATVALLVGLLLPGCSYLFKGEPIEEPADLIAVLPIDKAGGPAEQNGRIHIEADAANVVTAHIYGVLAESPRWRFVADLKTNDALRKVDAQATQVQRAMQLGKATSADAVLCGTVSRYMERVGSEYGATEPAAVSFKLQLVSVNSGRILWTADFDQSQKPLTEDLFKWWIIWDAGPKWVSASELTRIGVERLLDELDGRIP